MNTKSKLIIGSLFILAGALLGSGYLVQLIPGLQTHATTTNARPAAVDLSKLLAEKNSLPVHLDVAAVGVSIDVVPGYYDYSTNTWTLSDSKASFAAMTSVPNTKSGNTYIYGHNQSAVFAKVNSVKTGDTAVITNADGVMFAYSLARVVDVAPSDLNYLQYTGKPILTLQTCHGLWDQYRRLFIFDFVSKSDA